MSVDPLADAGGQQVLSPYHAMGGNPVSMVDPWGLQYFAPGSKIPNNAIPNAGVAYIEGQRVVLGGSFLNLAARQFQADERFTDFLIGAAIRDALGYWKATGQLGVPGAGSAGNNEQSANNNEGQNAGTAT